MIQNRNQLNMVNDRTVSEGIILNNEGVSLNPDKIQTFKGFEIDFTGDIVISCSWCNKMHELLKSTLRTGFFLAASNTTKKIVVFSINPAPNLRHLNIEQLPGNGHLFGYQKYNNTSFSIRNANFIDLEGGSYKVTPKIESAFYSGNESIWDGELSSRDWDDMSLGDQPRVKNRRTLINNPTGWEIKGFNKTLNKNMGIKSEQRKIRKTSGSISSGKRGGY